MKQVGYLLLVGLVFQAQVKYEYEVFIPSEESIEIGREDLQGRLEYEQMLLTDPKTGELPINIYNKEIQFSQKMDIEFSSARTEQLEYESLGPVNVGGRTRAIAFDIRNENTILAGGVSGGVFKSTDGGITWERKSDPENRNSVTCIVQDVRPGKQNIWYHGTGEIIGNSARGGQAPFRGNGIYKSVDNGETWNPIESTQDSEPHVFNSQFQYIWNIVVNPNNPSEDELLVAAFGGILRSTDGGDTWEVVLGQKLFDLEDDVNLNEINTSFFTSLELSPDGYYYAALSTFSSPEGDSPDGGIYVSLDGLNWMDINPLPSTSQYRRIVIGINESNPKTTYYLIDRSPVSLYSVTINDIVDGNADFSFTNLTENVPNFGGDLGDFDTQNSYNMLIRIHPENERIIFLGGTNLYRSLDGFTSTNNSKWIGGYTPEGGSGTYPNHHPDQHNLLFYPSNPNQIISTNDGGIRLSFDATADSVRWTSLNNGFVSSQFYTIAQSKVRGSSLVIGGMQDNGTDIRRNNFTNQWRGIIGGDGSYVATTDDDNYWFASFQQGQTFRIRLNDNLSTIGFSRIDPANLVSEARGSFLFINPYVIDPVNQNRVIFLGGNAIYLNENVSQIPTGTQEPSNLGWSVIEGTFDRNLSYTALAISNDGKVAYAGTSRGRIFKISNIDQPIGHETEFVGFPVNEDAYVSCIAVNPEDSDHILVIYSNYNIPSIFESLDGGNSFVEISGNMEENPDGSGNGPSIRWAEVVPLNSGIQYFIGTSIGLYATKQSDGLNTIWEKQASDLIGSSVVTMMDYRLSDGSLVIATHGNGVFRSFVDDYKEISPDQPDVNSFNLVNAFPNPFNEETRIQYELPKTGDVKIDVHSSTGRLIKTILMDNQFAGRNSVVFNGRGIFGNSLSNGIYYVVIHYDGQVKSSRVILRR